MEKSVIPMPLNEKDICTDALLELLNDSWFNGSISRNGLTRDYFTVKDSVWCMVYKYNCETFILKPIDWASDNYHEIVEQRLNEVVQDLNNWNDDEYVRKVRYQWSETPKPKMTVSFYYETK